MSHSAVPSATEELRWELRINISQCDITPHNSKVISTQAYVVLRGMFAGSLLSKRLRRTWFEDLGLHHRPINATDVYKVCNKKYTLTVISTGRFYVEL